MTERIIEEAKDADLRGIESALLRAGQRARERARMTGTRLVFSQNGVLKFVAPECLEPVSQELADQTGRYGEGK